MGAGVPVDTARHSVPGQADAHGAERVRIRRSLRRSAYEYAAVASPAGLLFTAGACPLDADGAVVAPDDIGTQAGVAVDNLMAVLRMHGSDASNIVQTRIYVVGDRQDLVQAWGVIAARLDPHRPPSTLVGVTVLGYPDQLVEIEAVASLNV